jgi:hypothetical protein
MDRHPAGAMTNAALSEFRKGTKGQKLGKQEPMDIARIYHCSRNDHYCPASREV